MGYHYQLAITVLLLGITGVSADTMETWKLVAIIVPSVVGGLTLLTCFFYCCCWTSRGSGSMGMCGGCDNGCGGCDNGCRGGGCNGGCNAGCDGCCRGCDDCCGCCYAHPRQQVTQVYSSQQGPIQFQPAQVRTTSVPAIGYKEPTYVRSVPQYNEGVYGVSKQTAQVYGSAPPGFGYDGPSYGGGPSFGGPSGPYGGGVYGRGPY